MGKLNMIKVAEAQVREGAEQGFASTKFDKLKEGSNLRRILWPKGDSDIFFRDAYYHYRMGHNGDTTVLCPKTFGRYEDCPICKIAENLRNMGTAEAKKIAAKYAPRRRIFINVIDREKDPQGTTPLVLGIGSSVLKQILDTMLDSDYGDITDFTTGRDITIKRKGRGLDTEYSVLPRPSTSPASIAVTEETLDTAMSDFGFLSKEQSQKSMEAVLPYLVDPTRKSSSLKSTSELDFDNQEDNMGDEAISMLSSALNTTIN